MEGWANKDQTISTVAGTNVYWFSTSAGTRGFLQLGAVTKAPPGLKLRYRLLTEPPQNLSHESLAERLDAAKGISDVEGRSRALAVVATDAANAGQVQLVRAALGGIIDLETRDRTAFTAAERLVQRHLRRQAIDIAKTITSSELRDKALAQLAQ